MEVHDCRQLIEQLLSQYVDGELDDHTAQSLELHLQMCPPCASFLRTFLAAKRAARPAVLEHMSPQCERSLHEFLRRETGVAFEECSADCDGSHRKSEEGGAAGG
jgi:predicted HD phosphohydrolase